MGGEISLGSLYGWRDLVLMPRNSYFYLFCCGAFELHIRIFFRKMGLSDRQKRSTEIVFWSGNYGTGVYKDPETKSLNRDPCLFLTLSVKPPVMHTLCIQSMLNRKAVQMYPFSPTGVSVTLRGKY